MSSYWFNQLLTCSTEVSGSNTTQDTMDMAFECYHSAYVSILQVFRIPPTLQRHGGRLVASCINWPEDVYVVYMRVGTQYCKNSPRAGNGMNAQYVKCDVNCLCSINSCNK